MAAIDVFFIILILVAAVRGYFRGFITEVFSVATPVLAILGGILLSKPLSLVIAPVTGSTGGFWNQVICFLIVFIVIYLVIFLLSKMFHHLVEEVHLVGADRALGVVLGLLEGLTVTFVLIIVLSIIPLDATKHLIAGSFFRSLVAPFLPELLKPGTAAAALWTRHV